MVSKIVVNSPEYVCWHEAGHAVVAQAVGALVVEMELYREPDRSYGRSRVERTREQARHIALGGFAAEYLLFKANRLIRSDGATLTEPEFIDVSYRNAAEDFRTFWLEEAGSDQPDDIGLSQKQMDDQFMKYAIGRAAQVDVGEIERSANALLASGYLDEKAILRS